MYKKIIFVFLIALTLFIFPSTAWGSEDFTIKSDTEFIFKENFFEVKHKIYLRNNKTEKYAKNFTLDVTGINPEDVYAYDQSGALETNLKTIDENSKVIEVNFNENLVGIDKSREFTIEYIESSLISKTGGVTEITIPKLSKDSIFDEYNLKVEVPTTIGELAYISPNPQDILNTENSKTYYFSRSNLINSGVSIAFGEFQVFSFDISFHLENPILKSAENEIALPPDTPYQEIFYTSMEPKPNSLVETEEGNWVAKFKLSPRERLDVRVQGYVKLFSGPRFRLPVTQDFLEKNLKATEYWQTEDPRIISLAQELKTPENIYNYVVKNLKYNYENAIPNAKRKGAVEALSNSDQAICSEFTDTFIALARAAGIPAREVNGFAYTENPNLQPLSLVADVLHSWPEYWDKNRQSWIPIDPTWGNTTGGVDYFSKLDLKHFAFVFHGFSATHPLPPGTYKLGANPQKDIFVKFANLPNFEKNSVKVVIDQKDGVIFRGPKVIAKIYNEGPTILSNLSVQVNFDSELVYEDIVSKVLPFNEKTLEIEIPYGLFGSKMPKNVEFIISDNVYNFETLKNQKIIKDLLAILILIIIIILITFVYFKK